MRISKASTLSFFLATELLFLEPTEICLLCDKVAEFDTLKTQIIGCFTESRFMHREYTRKPREKGESLTREHPYFISSNQEHRMRLECLLDHLGDKGVSI